MKFSILADQPYFFELVINHPNKLSIVRHLNLTRQIKKIILFDIKLRNLMKNTINVDQDALPNFLEGLSRDMDAIRRSSESRQAFLKEQLFANDVTSDMSDACRELRRKIGIDNLSECQDIDLLKSYINRLEMFGDRIWCPKCNIMKHVGVRPVVADDLDQNLNGVSNQKSFDEQSQQSYEDYDDIRSAQMAQLNAYDDYDSEEDMANQEKLANEVREMLKNANTPSPTKMPAAKKPTTKTIEVPSETPKQNKKQADSTLAIFDAMFNEI